jgi:hypothetical protein
LSTITIFDHVSRYLDQLQSGLVERGFQTSRAKNPQRRSGILSLVPPAGVAASSIVSGLRRDRVFATTPDGLVRFAPHFPNSLSEVPRVLAALDRTLAELWR